jgi:hypothetical protein
MTDHREANPNPEDRAMIDLLDRDASRLRAEPDAGFEARVLRAAMRAEHDADAHVVVASIGMFRSSALRAAAAIALMLTVGVVSVVALRGGAASPTPTVAHADVLDEIEGWLGLDESVFARTNLASFRDELDSASSGISYDDLGDPIIDAEDWM